MQTEYNPLQDPLYPELSDQALEFLHGFMTSEPDRQRRVVDRITTADKSIENPNELRALYGLPPLEAPARQAG